MMFGFGFIIGMVTMALIALFLIDDDKTK